MVNKYSVIWLVLFVAAFNLNAQDHQFQNHNTSLIQLNPSFAGSNEGLRNQFSYRNQWPNLIGTVQSFYNSSDFFVKSINGGFALTLFAEDWARGTLKDNRVELAYAQHVRLGSCYKLIPSVQFSFCKKAMDKTRSNFGDVIDYRRSVIWNVPGTPHRWTNDFYDLASGLVLCSDRMFAGISVFHLNQPLDVLYGNSRLPMRYNFYASNNFFLNEKHVLQVSAIGFHQQQFSQLRLHGNFLYNKRWLIGGGYSSDFVTTANAGYRACAFSLNFSYDAAVSRKTGNTASSYEFSFSYNLLRKENRGELRSFETF
jgi:type IX secretion system PorP/SprF family membrane protein